MPENGRDVRAREGKRLLKEADYVGQEIRHGKIMRKVVLPDAPAKATAGSFGRSGQKAKDPEQLQGRAARKEGCFAHLCPVCMAAAGEPCRTPRGHVARAHQARRQFVPDKFGGGKA